MLNIKLSFNKGILFIRLFGVLSKTTNKSLEENVIPILLSNGIRNIIINLENINYIDRYGITSLNDINDIISSNNGKVVLCNLINSQVKNMLHKMNTFYESDNELTAKEEIKLWKKR